MAEPKRIKFLFKKAADYRLLPANGAWGGITTRGDFLLEFFVEHNITPDYVMHEVTTEGGLGNEIERNPGITGDIILVTRELVGGVSLSIEQAKNIANFIQEKCTDLEKEKKTERA
jgi:hypothetical protein